MQQFFAFSDLMHNRELTEMKSALSFFWKAGIQITGGVGFFYGLLVQVLVLSWTEIVPNKHVLWIWQVSSSMRLHMHQITHRHSAHTNELFCACTSWLLNVPYYTGESCLASSYVWMEKSHGYTACNSMQVQHRLGWIDLLGDRQCMKGQKRARCTKLCCAQELLNVQETLKIKKEGKEVGKRWRIRQWEAWHSNPNPLLFCWLNKCNWSHGAIGLQQNDPIYMFTFPVLL